MNRINPGGAIIARVIFAEKHSEKLLLAPNRQRAINSSRLAQRTKSCRVRLRSLNTLAPTRNKHRICPEFPNDRQRCGGNHDLTEFHPDVEREQRQHDAARTRADAGLTQGRRKPEAMYETEAER